MSRWAGVDRLLRTDPHDAGCEETIELLHAYAELVLAGADPERSYPGIAAHLRACDPCGQDLEGLLLAARVLGG